MTKEALLDLFSTTKSHYEAKRGNCSSLSEKAIVTEALISLQEIEKILTIKNENKFNKKVSAFLKKRGGRIRKSICWYTAIPDAPITTLCVELARHLDENNYYSILIPSLRHRSDIQSLLAEESLEEHPLNQLITADDEHSLIPAAILAWLTTDNGQQDVKKLVQPYRAADESTNKKYEYRDLQVLTINERERLFQHSETSKEFVDLAAKIDSVIGQGAFGKQLLSLQKALYAGSIHGSGNGRGTELQAGASAYEGIVNFYEYWEQLTPTQQTSYLAIHSEIKKIIDAIKRTHNDPMQCVAIISENLHIVIQRINQQYSSTLFKNLQEKKQKLEKRDFSGNEKYSQLPKNIIPYLCEKGEIHEAMIVELLCHTAEKELEEVYVFLKKKFLTGSFFRKNILAIAEKIAQCSLDRIQKIAHLLKKDLMPLFLNPIEGSTLFNDFLKKFNDEQKKAIFQGLEEDCPTKILQLITLMKDLSSITINSVLMAWKNRLAMNVNDLVSLNYLLEKVSSEQARGEIIKIVGYRTCKQWISSIPQLHYILKNLPKENCDALLNEFTATHLLDLIQCEEDLIQCFPFLNEQQKESILKEIDFSRYSISALEELLLYTSNTARKSVLNEALDRFKQNSITASDLARFLMKRTEEEILLFKEVILAQNQDALWEQLSILKPEQKKVIYSCYEESSILLTSKAALDQILSVASEEIKQALIKKYVQNSQRIQAAIDFIHFLESFSEENRLNIIKSFTDHAHPYLTVENWINLLKLFKSSEFEKVLDSLNVPNRQVILNEWRKKLWHYPSFSFKVFDEQLRPIDIIAPVVIAAAIFAVGVYLLTLIPGAYMGYVILAACLNSALVVTSPGGLLWFKQLACTYRRKQNLQHLRKSVNMSLPEIKAQISQFLPEHVQQIIQHYDQRATFVKVLKVMSVLTLGLFRLNQSANSCSLLIDLRGGLSDAEKIKKVEDFVSDEKANYGSRLFRIIVEKAANLEVIPAPTPSV